MNPSDTLCPRDLFVMVTMVDAYYVQRECARPICKSQLSDGAEV